RSWIRFRARRCKRAGSNFTHEPNAVDRYLATIGAYDAMLAAVPVFSAIIFPGSPERWWGDEALKAEAQAAQAPREERHQAACNILAMRPRSLFSAGVRFATASHIPVDTAQGRASASTRTSRSSRAVRGVGGA